MKRVVVVVVLSVLAAATCLGAPFEFYRAGWSVALFQNGTAETFAGLWVKFSSSVTLIQALGIGINLTMTSNEEGALVFEGTIPPFTMWEIDWPLDGPAVTDAAWIRADGRQVPINTHAPVARMQISLPPPLSPHCPKENLIPFFPINGTFTALGSSDPDGAPLAQYQWAWSDGACAEGYEVERRFDAPGRYVVTLTVWDAQGYSDTISRTFVIPRQLCSQCCGSG
jgi:hypothetical protein